MKIKKCSRCGIEKTLSEFYKNTNYKDGLTYSCKKCLRESCLNYRLKNKEKISKRNKNIRKLDIERFKNYKQKYRTKFPWRIVLTNIKQRCNNFNDTRYKNYGGRGIKCLITANELKELWIRDKAFLMKRPSIDRINNDGNYIYENCRFIEMRENMIKGNKEAHRKIVIQYDLDGNFIKEWKCAFEIKKQLGFDNSHISQCCKKNQKTSYGFIWRYKDD